MTYNIHPLLVHFPIALLLVYSVIKIIPLRRWFPDISWRHIERMLLVVGTAGAFAALSTGEIAEHLTRPNHDLVEAHSLFASTTVWTYSLLLVGELLSLFLPWIILKINSPIVIKVISFFRDLLTHPILLTTLATLGLVTLSLTGLLGGVMVYGINADPVAPFVLKILGIVL